MSKPLSILSISKACTQTLAMASYQNTNAKSQILNAAEVTPKVGLKGNSDAKVYIAVSKILHHLLNLCKFIHSKNIQSMMRECL